MDHPEQVWAASLEAALDGDLARAAALYSLWLSIRDINLEASDEL